MMDRLFLHTLPTTHTAYSSRLSLLPSYKVLIWTAFPASLLYKLLKEHIRWPNDSGITIVVSPLISLMKDQVDAAENRCSIPGLNQGQGAVQWQSETLRAGRIKLLYVPWAAQQWVIRRVCPRWSDWLSLMKLVAFWKYGSNSGILLKNWDDQDFNCAGGCTPTVILQQSYKFLRLDACEGCSRISVRCKPSDFCSIATNLHCVMVLERIWSRQMQADGIDSIEIYIAGIHAGV